MQRHRSESFDWHLASSEICNIRVSGCKLFITDFAPFREDYWHPTKWSDKRVYDDSQWRDKWNFARSFIESHATEIDANVWFYRFSVLQSTENVNGAGNASLPTQIIDYIDYTEITMRVIIIPYQISIQELCLNKNAQWIALSWTVRFYSLLICSDLHSLIPKASR